MPTNLNSETYDKFVRALFVGGTGRGKTIAAASWPGKTLIIDIDDRHKPVVDWFPERVKAGDFSIERVNADNIWTTLKPTINNIVKYNPFQNVIVDGVTSLSTTTVIMQMKAKGSWGDWSSSKGSDESKGAKITAGGVMVPSWDEYAG